ncbi:MAG: patatin-like phospholipase family protein, partial [Proteobacteria bacterium]|nr:patatin-like phospholipase family protein [Pseudomonadota bacterium]
MPRPDSLHQKSPMTALVLQGGGALGAYQAGAYEALAERAQSLDWVAGISIGAINAALIAGNPPQRRVDRLRAFWERVSVALPVRPDPELLGPARGWWDNAMALWGALVGVPGFFAPRPPLAWWPQPPVSWYDTAPLHDTLLELVDFDLLNDGPIRFSVGAVDVQSGNFTYFDNRRERIGPEHVMASGALPPGFAAVPIGDRWYWDGGLVSNTPLTYVMDHLDGGAERLLTVFQIDLFNARGRVPETLADAAEREKDIRYSSRTRLVSDLARERHELH